MLRGNSGASARRLDVASLHGGDEQAEAGDDDGERVLVYAVQAVQDSADQLPGVRCRCVRSSIWPAGARRRRAGSGLNRRRGRSSAGRVAGRGVRVAGLGQGRTRRSPGSRVRSRMNSSTNSGVCSSAYVFLAYSDRSW